MWGRSPTLKRGGGGGKPPSLGSDSPHPKHPFYKEALLSGKNGAVLMVVKFSDFRQK